MPRKIWTALWEHDARPTTEYLKEIGSDTHPIRYYIVLGVVALSVGATLLTSPISSRWHVEERAERDANGDGKNDLIVKKRNYVLGIPTWRISEEVFYGTGKELNGRQIFLPEYLWKEYTLSNP